MRQHFIVFQHARQASSNFGFWLLIFRKVPSARTPRRLYDRDQSFADGGASSGAPGKNSAPDQIEPRMPRSGSRGLMTPDILSQTELTAGRSVSQRNAASGF